MACLDRSDALAEERVEPLSGVDALGPLVSGLAQEGLDRADAVECLVGGGVDAAAISAEQDEVALPFVGGEDLPQLRGRRAVRWIDEVVHHAGEAAHDVDRRPVRARGELA